MTKHDFRAYCVEILLPQLKKGATLVLDNSPIHKDIEDIFTDKGIDVLYLPPYTPEYNPIEMMWAKIKLFLRKNRSKNLTQLKQNITKAFNSITNQDIKDWFLHCGYQC